MNKSERREFKRWKKRLKSSIKSNLFTVPIGESRHADNCVESRFYLTIEGVKVPVVYERLTDER